MKQDSGIPISLSLVALLGMIAPAHAQETRASLTEPRPTRSRDRATEFTRREAEARVSEREKVFARLKELSPPPALPRVAVEAGVVNPVILLERLPTVRDNDEADVLAPPPPRFVVAAPTFDRYILHSTGARDSRVHLESILTRRIESIDRQRRLTPGQKTKLLLAGRGDIKRLFDRVEDERKQFEPLRTDFGGCLRFLHELQPLWNTMRQGPFDDGSLFGKTLKKIEEDAAARTPM
jgi:hypothetical protein